MTEDTLFPNLQSTTKFSACGRYRWSLTRTWDTTQPPLVFLMLNPSTADATVNDPTVTRCIQRARRLGHGGVVVLNLFAWRATDPVNLPADELTAVGERNDMTILVHTLDRPVVCAWGVHGVRFDRGRKVAVNLERMGRTLHSLGLTKDGHPRHPLYVPADRPLVPYTAGVQPT